MATILIWDFNGTILDDTQLCLDIENKMLEDRGMKHGYSISEYRDLFCFPVKSYYQKIGYTFENESYEEISVEFNDEYDAGFSKTKLMEGFIEKIEEAHEKGYQNIILSASHQDKLRMQCERLNITPYFNEILGIDNLLASSKIDMAKAWMNHKKIDPQACKYIGDTLHDEETANALGISDCILVSCGHQSEKLLMSSSARVVSSLKDVEL